MHGLHKSHTPALSSTAQPEDVSSSNDPDEMSGVTEASLLTRPSSDHPVEPESTTSDVMFVTTLTLSEGTTRQGSDDTSTNIEQTSM